MNECFKKGNLALGAKGGNPLFPVCTTAAQHNIEGVPKKGTPKMYCCRFIKLGDSQETV